MERALATSRPPSGKASPPHRPIRLMIVDDSMVARAVLSRMVETDGAFEIAAVAGTAEDAIDALQFVQVDVILLDLEMPGAGGLQTLPRIIEAARGARVMIVSSLAEDGAEETIAALAMGAADTLPKPGTGRFNGRFSEILIGKLRALGHVEHKGPRIPEPLRQRFESPLRAMSPDPVELLAIGASTGGIHALGCLFQALPLRIQIPILVTQHLPAAFMTVFARQLGVAAKREALVAEDGMALLPDRIVIAPGDAHLKVELAHGQLVARLDRKRSPSGCLPSIDPMFASAAAALGSAVMGVVLTGMGRDGVEGATHLVACGGSVMAQDEASCAVYGMPRAVAEAGLVCAVMAPDKLARRIAARAGERSWR